MKTELKIKAIKLRQEGYSISELANELKVSKSSISLWVKDLKLSKEAQKIIGEKYTNGQLKSMKVIKNKIKIKNEEADKKALELLKNNNISKENTILICAMIYNCEGTKSIKDSFVFTNSDPSLIQTFLYLFRKGFKINEKKLRVLMHLHDYHNENKQKEFWSKITKIPENQFYKTFQKSNSGLFKKENYQGCIQIRYNDVEIGRIIRAVAKKFMERYK